MYSIVLSAGLFWCRVYFLTLVFIPAEATAPGPADASDSDLNAAAKHRKVRPT